MKDRSEDPSHHDYISLAGVSFIAQWCKLLLFFPSLVNMEQMKCFISQCSEHTMQLYGYMTSNDMREDHREETCWTTLHGLLFLIKSKAFFICTIPQTWPLVRERNVLFNDALNTFYLHYMASDIWLRTILIVRKETRCHHIGYSYRLTARVLLYAPSHRQDNTYHSLCYTSRGALAGTRNSPMGPPHEG